MILALESSCDETALACFRPDRGLTHEWVHSQMALHGRYGGVVPDLATREHLRTLGPLLGVAKEALGSWEEIRAVAVTQGPGLAGCLAIGTAAAKALSLAWKVPLLPVNHLRGHAFSPFIAVHQADPAAMPAEWERLLPHLGLIVSGGNTLLFCLDRERRIHVLATTRDDAAGEALDKGAKLLGLGYPGGPLVEERARAGRKDAYDFPRGLGPRSELDFSFSGVKTSLRYQLEKMTPEAIETAMGDLCASYQQAILDALLRKLEAAWGQGTYRSLGLSGGVANNRLLRESVESLARRKKVPALIAAGKHSGDNAGMIGFAAWADPAVQPCAPADLRIQPSLELAGSSIPPR